MEHFSLVNFCTTLLLCITAVSATAPRVTIKNGTLEGTTLQSRKGRNFYAFLGIPYAQPPVGELRFEPPKPTTGWAGVRNAKVDGSICLQQNYENPELKTTGSEDCLNLNVYTPGLPNSRSKRRSKRYAVMVWFFGGGIEGNAHSKGMYGPTFLLDHDIVLVTMNWRLGPLGLLSTADDVIPGNQALKDHVQALRWVQENIAAFGGDPNKVTIAGESAGAGDVHLVALSPLARGLFHQVITQSGTAINPWVFNTPTSARRTANRLGRELNCSTETSAELLRCLRTKDASDIVTLPLNWPIFNGAPDLPFKAVVESNRPGAFLTQEPDEILRRGDFPNYPWINGVNANEGAGGAVGIYLSPNQENLEILNNNFSYVAPITFKYDTGCSQSSQAEISRKIREHYFGDKIIDDSSRAAVVDMYTDGVFSYASATAVKDHLHAHKGPAYFYYFGYRGSLSFTLVFGDEKNNYGVSHADELLYLFPVAKVLLPNRTMTEKDYQMVDVMTTLWTNFVKTGQPVPQTSCKLPVKWEPVATDALENFVIESPTSFKMSRDTFKDQFNFWGSLPCRAGLTRSVKLPNA